MNILEMRLIIENVKEFGGFREHDVLKRLTKIELIQDDETYKVYRFENEDGNYFEYDFKSQSITG